MVADGGAHSPALRATLTSQAHIWGGRLNVGFLAALDAELIPPQFLESSVRIAESVPLRVCDTDAVGIIRS